MAIKSKKTTTKAETTTTAEKKTTKKGNKYDAQIAECRAAIEENKAKIKELLAAKLNEQSGDWEIGSTVYYPAPPQKEIIPCRLEIEEDSNGEIVYFVRPICVDKKTGAETLSKRHYSLGTDLYACTELYKDAPKNKKKSEKKDSKKTAEKTSAKKPAKEEPVEEKKPVKKATLGGKKKLGKK